MMVVMRTIESAYSCLSKLPVRNDRLTFSSFNCTASELMAHLATLKEDKAKRRSDMEPPQLSKAGRGKEGGEEM
jgi:hypothetical protein